MNEVAYPHTKLLIANRWVDSSDGRQIPVVNPATGEVIGQVAHAGLSDLRDALAAAETGFATWKALPAYERCQIMRKAAGLLREREKGIARLITLEQGKPIAEAEAELTAAAEIIEWFAQEGTRVSGRVVPSRTVGSQHLVLKEPIGPVAAFTPWNYPVNQVVRKLGAALAAGCSILVKAAEETPASPAALLQAFVDAGVPAGVVGLVYGTPDEISSYLISSPIIRKVTFTGSTPVGKRLAALAGSHMKPVTMELGGHAPVIIAEDANIDHAVETIGIAAFRNGGQVCISPTRFLVHNSIKPQFVKSLAALAQSLKVGNGLDASTQLGPLANARRVETMTIHCADSISKGAKIVTGGHRVGEVGNFFAATVIDDVPTDALLFNEEPFGPVAGIQGFDSLDDAVAEANRLPYGLAAYAFSRSYKNIQALIHGLEVGMVWVNQRATPYAELPFGGVKDSGFGSEGGPEAVAAYLTTKTASIVGI